MKLASKQISVMSKSLDKNKQLNLSESCDGIFLNRIWKQLDFVGAICTKRHPHRIFERLVTKKTGCPFTMFIKKWRLSLKVLTVAFIVAISGCAIEPDQTVLKLYAMNCGKLEVSDMGPFSVEGKLDGQKESLVNPCFLIRHPKGDLIWDVGYNESLADRPEGDKGGAFHWTMKVKLTDQLEQLALRPSDIEYFSISHLHPDHSGNANLFADSTFIANIAEHNFMFSAEMRKNNEFFEGYSALEDVKPVLYRNEYDVFGDNLVIMKSMPGHTPGSSVLLLRLKNSGAVLLTGDLYTHSKARELKTVPTFNTDRVATVESRIRFEALAKEEKALVVIQHNKVDFDALPRFPLYLD